MNRIIYRKLEENNKIYRIKVKIKNISLSLLILEETKDEFNAYETPLVLETDLRKQADERRIEFNEYYDKLIFFLENPEKAAFTFNKKSFKISERLNENILANYFQCDIHKVKRYSSFIGTFIDEIHEEISQSQTNLCSISDKYDLLKNEAEEYKTKLTELVERKNVDEEVMLSNFVSLLNEKKRRIQHLIELLETFQNNPSLANPVDLNISYQNKQKRINLKNEVPSSSRIKEEVSNSSLSSNDDDYTTDNEKFEGTGERKLESTVTNKCFDDLSEEPSKPLLTLPDISREFRDSKYVSTLGVENCVKDGNIDKLESAVSQTELTESKCFDTPSINMNTQDWLDRL